MGVVVHSLRCSRGHADPRSTVSSRVLMLRRTDVASQRRIYAIVACVKSTMEHSFSAGHTDSTLPQRYCCNDTALVQVLIPSLTLTIRPSDLKRWSVRLYLCADDTDSDTIFHAGVAEVC